MKQCKESKCRVNTELRIGNTKGTSGSSKSQGRPARYVSVGVLDVESQLELRHIAEFWFVGSSRALLRRSDVGGVGVYPRSRPITPSQVHTTDSRATYVRYTLYDAFVRGDIQIASGW